MLTIGCSMCTVTYTNVTYDKWKGILHQTYAHALCKVLRHKCAFAQTCKQNAFELYSII